MSIYFTKPKLHQHQNHVKINQYHQNIHHQQLNIINKNIINNIIFTTNSGHLQVNIQGKSSQYQVFTTLGTSLTKQLICYLEGKRVHPAPLVANK